MRVLLDECLPRRLKHSLPEHDVTTVQELGWSSKKAVSPLSFGIYIAPCSTRTRAVSYVTYARSVSIVWKVHNET
jgi:hypothetical protein